MPHAARSLAALAALALACKWPIPAVAGEPDTAKICIMECPIPLKSKIVLRYLQSYTISTCKGKTSIILKTKKNKTFCANGDDAWVKKAMADLDAKNAPSPPRHGPTTGNLPVANRHSGEANLEVGDQAQPTKKASTASYKTTTLPVRTTGDRQPSMERGLAGLKTTTSPTPLTPQPETPPDKSTLQPDLIADKEIESETTEGHKKSEDHVTPTRNGLEDFTQTTQRSESPPMPFLETDRTSTDRFPLVSETRTSPSTRPSMNSSTGELLLEVVTKDKTSVTIPTKLSNPSDQGGLFFSSFSTGHKPQSVEDSTTQRSTNFSSHPTAHSGSGGNSFSSFVHFRGVIDREGEGDTPETPLPTGNGTLERTFSRTSDAPPISVNRQEIFNESTSVFNSNIRDGSVECFPRSQSMVSIYVIPAVSIGGALCVLSAIGVLVYLKRKVCTGQPPRRQVRGLTYYPCDSQAESYSMELV